MSSTELFRKHFGNKSASVDLKHPNMEKFFGELNEEFLLEDRQKQCDHSWVYKILHDHTPKNVCDKCCSIGFLSLERFAEQYHTNVFVLESGGGLNGDGEDYYNKTYGTTKNQNIMNQKSKPPIIYISGKITGMEEKALGLFAEAEEKFRQIGFEIINPMTLNHNHDKRWSSYMKVCLRALFDCDMIYMLSNWKDSEGAIIEHNLALALDIKVIYEPLHMAIN